MNKEVTCNNLRMEKALEIALGSTCSRRQVGAIIYNGSTYLGCGTNVSNDRMQCRECYRTRNKIESGYELDKCFAVHAEQRAILDVVSNGKFDELKGSTLYVTTFPCVTCMKLLIEVGVSTIVYTSEYNSEMATSLASKFNITLIKHDDGRTHHSNTYKQIDFTTIRKETEVTYNGGN